MSPKTPLFQCGELTIRSNKAAESIKLYQASEYKPNTQQDYLLKGILPRKDKCFFLHKPIEPTEFLLQDESETYLLTRIDQPIFFDQTPYIFTLHLPDAVDANVFSPIVSLCEEAIWDPDTQRLTIPINFRNDLGDFELCWEWASSDGELLQGSIQGQVFSTKLDIYSHFKWMIQDIEKFNWIQLDLLRKTTWGWSYDSDSDSTIRTWLLIFQKVRAEMGSGFYKLLKQHRRKLNPENRMLRADKIRKASSRLEEKIAEGLKSNPNARYSIQKKVLDINTPENKYMKHILFQTTYQLNDIIDKVEEIDTISDVFKIRIKEWAEEWGILKQHHFWKGIGPFTGLKKESLILSQDPLYSGIRRSWFLLQQGLSFFEQDLKGGIQNSAQLYEIWCLVKIMQLVESFDWICDSSIHFEKTNEELINDDERKTPSAKFIYNPKEGTILANNNFTLEILYQPSASENPNKKSNAMWSGIKSVPVIQQPDIVLRLLQSKKAIHTWIFDAKYRINSKSNSAPNDAINQMHRYRDAILWSNQPSNKLDEQLYRESIGAYVLYPGNEIVDANKHKQLNSINTVNIGAFPLKPYDAKSDDGTSKHKEIKMMFSTLFDESFNETLKEGNFDNVDPFSTSIYTKSPKI